MDPDRATGCNRTDHLADLLVFGCLSTTACPLRNPVDELSEQGAGPRLLDPGSD